MTRSLFSKILTSHLVVILLITASTGLLLSHLVTNYLIEAKRDELLLEGASTSEFLSAVIQSKQLLPSLLDNLSKLSGTTMWMTNSENRVISGQPPKGWRHRISRHGHKRQDDFTGQVKSWVYRDRNDEDPSIVVAVPLPDNSKTALYLYTPITGIARTSASIQELLFYSFLGSIALASVFAFFLSRNLTNPISNISRAAEKFAAGNYDSRTSATGQDEIGKLGSTFNEMAAVLTRIEKNRREFFSDVTHELKTPIASIQALTESMIDGLVTEEDKRQRYLGTILDETKHMNQLISGLLNLAQLESVRMKFDYQPLDLRIFIQNQEQKYQALLAEKNQQLLFKTAPTLHTFKTDETRLEQILTNLISNAIRHSLQNGTIIVEFIAEGTNIVISVIDHGEGIPEQALPHLWDRFYRVDKSRARSKGGTGLGLSITKKLTEGMGGTVAVTSIQNQETIFRITLPQN